MATSKKLHPESTVATLRSAEKALKELVSEGKKISQYAVEKRAGLSNGALNYKGVPEYAELKERIRAAKAVSSPAAITPADKEKLKKEESLKKKYRDERDEARNELKKVLSENMELKYQLFHLQSYLRDLENKGLASADVIDISKRMRAGRSKR